MINHFIHEFPRNKVNYLIFTFKKRGHCLNDLGDINNKCLTVSAWMEVNGCLLHNTLKTGSNTNRLMMMMMKIRSVSNFLWHEICVQVKADSVSSHFTESSESKMQLCDKNEPGKLKTQPHICIWQLDDCAHWKLKWNNVRLIDSGLFLLWEIRK